MWDIDEKTRLLCQLSMPAIRVNYYKLEQFYNNYFVRTSRKYTSSNFDEIQIYENVDGFVCGSDTIFCIDEFKGFDDGFFANYSCMKNGYSVTYAASFGDVHFDQVSYDILNQRLQNFKYIGLRENSMIPYVKEHTSIEVERTIDPTLLIDAEEYSRMATDRIIHEKYLLLYSRRNNESMEVLADKIAKENGWEVVEISLKATNSDKHIMRYNAGVEEFLSLVKHAEYIVTNSFHGTIFAIQFKRPFYAFSREYGKTKIVEVLELFGLQNRLIEPGVFPEDSKINFCEVHDRLNKARNGSLSFLKRSLEGINR